MNTSKTLARVVLITAAVTVAALGIAALIGLASGGFRTGRFGGTGISVDERKTLPLNGIDLVSIEGVSENIRIVEGTGDSLEAWLHGTAGAASSASVPRLVDDRAGSRLTVRVDRNRTISFGFSWSTLVLEVSVPKGYAQKLAVKTVSGDIRVADHGYAGLAVSTTSGDAEVGSVTAAELSMRTVSGSLSADSALAKRSELSSVSGDVRVKLLKGDATLHSTSGSVNVGFAEVSGRIDASNTSGDVVLRFPADAKFRLEARSTSGEIRCAFAITIAQSETGGGRHALAGAVGSGTAPVTVRTVSGDIRIEK